MMNATLRGKPDAGNPHVRFDEGEVAPVKPRRGSLLYKNLIFIGCAMLALSGCSPKENQDNNLTQSEHRRDSGDDRLSVLMSKADRGDAEAMLELGSHFKSNGNAPNAAFWYRKAIERGSVPALRCLGDCYAEGTGVERDAQKAANWYRKAAIKNDARAMVKLGMCYVSGTGVKQDPEKALHWLEKASEKLQDRPELKDDFADVITRLREAIKLMHQNGFNGIVFGADIYKYKSDYYSPKKYDNSNDRRPLESAGKHKLSYHSVVYCPPTAFRKFNTAAILASWKSKRVFQAQYRYTFLRTTTTAADRAELQQSIAALNRKYGDPVGSKGSGDGDEDCSRVWRKGDLIVQLDYVSEGRIDRAYMALYAWSAREKELATKESEEYFNERMSAEVNNIQVGGEDAL